MSESTLINEIAKLKASGSSGGGSLAPHSQGISPISTANLIVGSSQYTTSRSYFVQSSSSYRAMFNLGNGQFAAGCRHYLSGTSAAEAYVRPFTVDQNTGIITPGSGASGFSSGSNIDTGTWAASGNYVMTQHTSGNSGNTYTGFVVSGNSVTNTANTSPGASAQPMSNENTASIRNGSTMYMYGQVYNSSDGRFRRSCAQFNGSSVSMSENSDPSSNTSTTYSWPVAPQFGYTSPNTYAGIRSWQNSSGNQILDILNNTGSYVSQVTGATVGSMGSDPSQGFGLELSNGRQLFYQADGRSILLNNGGTLSNVTATADWVPNVRDNSITTIWPVATDTWVTVSKNPFELIKFSVNPTTYKVTIIKTAFLGNYDIAINSYSNSMPFTSMTGSNNQYLVIGTWQSYAPFMVVSVFPTPF